MCLPDSSMIRRSSTVIRIEPSEPYQAYTRFKRTSFAELAAQLVGNLGTVHCVSTHEGSPQVATQGSPGKRRLAPDQLKALLDAATYLPAAWVVALAAIAVATALDITVEKGEMRWHISVGTISLVAVALIWLPTALRLMSLTGGSVKAAGVEAAASGILSTDDLAEGLARVQSVTEAADQGTIGTESLVESVGATVDQLARKYLPAEETLADEVLTGLARRYEDIRRSQPPSTDRTISMNQLVNEVLIRAKAAPEAARRKARAFLRSDRDGDRIVGLGLAEGSPSVELLDDILRIFSSSRSAFEQYHSLLALDALVDRLGAADRAKAARTLQHEMTDPRNLGLKQDPYIPGWITRVLTSLGEEPEVALSPDLP
jgi:hypothetical protein